MWQEPLSSAGWLGPASVAALVPVSRAMAASPREAWAAVLGLDLPCSLGRLTMGLWGRSCLSRLVETAVLELLPLHCFQFHPPDFQARAVPLIAGSWALRRYLQDRGHSPLWEPNDVDVYFPNRAGVWVAAEAFQDRLKDVLGLETFICTGAYDHNPGPAALAAYAERLHMSPDQLYQGLFDGLAPSQLEIRAAAQLCEPVPLERFQGPRCTPMEVVDVHYRVGKSGGFRKVSFIGVVAATPGESYVDVVDHIPPLLAMEVLAGFDLDLCRVGLQLPVPPPGMPVTWLTHHSFEAAVQAGRGKLCVRPGHEAKAWARVAKYRARGFVIEVSL